MFGRKKKEPSYNEDIAPQEKTVSLKQPGRSVTRERRLQKQADKPEYKKRKSNAAEARFLFSHLNHKTGKRHTVEEIATILGESKAAIKRYILREA